MEKKKKKKGGLSGREEIIRGIYYIPVLLLFKWH